MAGTPGSLREIARIERALEEYDRAGRSVLV
jgi:hypothetical protein